jgi:CheY-like chemotaxis protein
MGVKDMKDSEKVDILLVEDNPSDVELALRAMNKHNLSDNVHVAKDGAEALEYIFATGSYAGRDIKNKLKVVLLDLKLPRVDGLEVLRRIKSDERTKTTPVVVLTSSTEEKDILESYQSGANSYVVKPVNFDKFHDTVSQLSLYWSLLNQLPL